MECSHIFIYFTLQGQSNKGEYFSDPIRSMCNVFLMLGLLLSIQVPYGEGIFIRNPELSIKGKPPNGSVAG